MPISAMEGYTSDHWRKVFDIVSSSVSAAGFTPNLVSNAEEAGIIQKTIVQNLYENPVLVCDVSAKNPNVMFELGMRLAFDKPTIIVKDDATSYSFDTGQIEHLDYPRDLRFDGIVAFKDRLARKIKATHKKSTTDPNYTTFLKHFGDFKVAKIGSKEVSPVEILLDEMRGLRQSVKVLEFQTTHNLAEAPYKMSQWFSKFSPSDEADLVDTLDKLPGVLHAVQSSEAGTIVHVTFNDERWRRLALTCPR